jgi:hypothetical protein
LYDMHLNSQGNKCIYVTCKDSIFYPWSIHWYSHEVIFEHPSCSSKLQYSSSSTDRIPSTSSIFWTCSTICIQLLLVLPSYPLVAVSATVWTTHLPWLLFLPSYWN